MQVLPISAKNIIKARKIIRQGGVIIYPTDTLYGLGADIFNLEAIKKIFAIKGRDFKKPISVMISSWLDLKKIVIFNNEQEKYLRGLWPGPFTLILKKRGSVSKILTAGKNKIGLRWSSDKFCQQLTKNLPITTTSANLSGQINILKAKRLIKEFAGQVDLILIGRHLSGQASRVIDLTTKPIKILR